MANLVIPFPTDLRSWLPTIVGSVDYLTLCQRHEQIESLLEAMCLEVDFVEKALQDCLKPRPASRPPTCGWQKTRRDRKNSHALSAERMALHMNSGMVYPIERRRPFAPARATCTYARSFITRPSARKRTFCQPFIAGLFAHLGTMDASQRPGGIPTPPKSVAMRPDLSLTNRGEFLRSR
jgi:hypothetical protein